jgi:TIR domain
VSDSLSGDAASHSCKGHQLKIFISWSGDRSQALAEALRTWLPLVLHYAKPWFSTSDIKSGNRWGIEIAKELQDTNFGILCVTKDNIDAPWLIFEAGALAKSIDDGCVIPLLLDLDKSDLTGPLTQFQAEKTDNDGIKKLIESLNKAAPASVPDETLQPLFGALWASFEEKLNQIPTSGAPQKKSRPQADILEELVTGVRSVEMRVRDVMDDYPENRMRRRRRLHPEMVMDISHRISDGPDDPIQLLILASLFREEVPWLYELALEAYRAIRSGDSKIAHDAYRRFKEALETLRRGPFLEMLGMDSKMVHMVLMDTLEFLPSFDLLNEAALKKPLAKRRARPI